MADAIRALLPRYVIIENVPGIATKMGSRPGESALGTVVADLAEAGYVGSWIRVRASDVGAPHKRERVFILATYAGSERQHWTGRTDADLAPGEGDRRISLEGLEVPPADTFSDSERWPRSGEVLGAQRAGVGEGAERERLRADLGDGSSVAADTDSGRRTRVGEQESGRLERTPGNVADRRDREGQAASHSDIELSRYEGGGISGGRGRAGSESNPQAPTDTDGERRAQHGGAVSGETEISAIDGDSERREWGIYAPAVLRWERTLGRSAPRPTDDRRRLNPEFTEWMMGFPIGWTEGETRTQRLKMLGNAVVVQVGEVVGGMLRG